MDGDGGEGWDGLLPLLSDFRSGFKVALSLHDPSGKKLFSLPGRAQAPFCRKIGGWLYDPAICAAQSHRMRHLASDRADTLAYTCHAGLRCCVHPFTSGGRLLAFAQINEYRFGESPGEEVLRAWRRDVGAVDLLLRDYLVLPRFTAEAEQHMIRLFRVVAEHAISHGFISVPRSALFDSIVDYVRSHIRRPSIPIDEVAEHVSKSPSTVSHVVKKEAGISFKRLVIEKKLEEAEHIMSSRSTPSIGEVAEILGYSDQFYFSRLYKKYRGFPPKEFVRRRVV
ncbi:MAG TPA: helix-turn-helix domain-containing protein [Rectinemataceae bacterium]|nr:helix-turn-helix domain-containing protein [Rectinemataceae bacterium]